MRAEREDITGWGCSMQSFAAWWRYNTIPF